MKISQLAILIIFCAGSALFAESETPIDPIATANSHAAILEGAKVQIDYCMANLNKKFTEIDINKAQPFPGDTEIGVITYGIIAHKYLMQYGDTGKAADYYYLEWKHTPMKNWPAGEYAPLSEAIGDWLKAGRYKDLAKHYEEYLVEDFGPLKYGSFAEKRKSMLKHIAEDKEIRAEYEEEVKNWENYKKLAHTTKPRPLDPAVQTHEWFYSDKQEEVLKALEYYHKHAVRFMLEKAAKRKDSVIAAKAKEYLDNPVKPEETTGDENKK